ncbi:unnamed protein product [Chrysoparadoxa australica]
MVIQEQSRHESFLAKHLERHNKSSREESDDKESGVLFWKRFNAEHASVVAAVDAIVARSAGDNKAAMAADLDKQVYRAQELQKSAAEASNILPKYDVRRAGEEVAQLMSVIDSAREKIAPRKKFSFKKRAQKAAPMAGPSAALKAPAPVVAPVGQFIGDDSKRIKLEGLKGETISVSQADLPEGCDYKVLGLIDCTVGILGVTYALRLEGLRGCIVYSGPVSGSIYVENCQDCTVYAAGRQLRIHDSENVDFYVLIKSGPIIEKCHGMRFAPYSLAYQGMSTHLEAASLADVTNKWHEVHDFGWHKTQHSPNWSQIPEGERVCSSKLQGISISINSP